MSTVFRGADGDVRVFRGEGPSSGIRGNRASRAVRARSRAAAARRRCASAIRRRRSASGLQHRAHVPRALVEVLERPSGCGYAAGARHHDQVAVEASLQDEPGPGDVRPKGHDDHRVPPVFFGQTTQLAALALRGRRVRDETVHGDVGPLGGAQVGQSRVVGPTGIRNDQVGGPTPVGQLDAESLFYLRSRGLSMSDARSILIHAFASEVVDRMSLPSVRSHIAGVLLERLPQPSLQAEGEA